MDCILFFEKTVKRDNDYVPPYLFYLYDQLSSDNRADINCQIKKILLVDYKNKYKNYNNTVSLIMQKVDEVISLFITLTLFLVVAAFLYILGCILYLVLEAIKTSFTVGIKVGFGLIGNRVFELFIIMLIYLVIYFVVLKLSNIIYKDEYSLKKETIKRHITSKTNYYDNLGDKFQL